MQAAAEASRTDGDTTPLAVVRLAGVLHWEEQHALKAVARQLCAALGCPYVASASFEENLKFFHDTLRSVSKCGAPSSPLSKCACVLDLTNVRGLPLSQWVTALECEAGGNGSGAAACRAKQAAIFVLDDFHLFTRRGRPTTLYNLLDALQAHGVKAAVVATSVDHGAVDAMEKRARSRFSHRKVVVPPPCDVTDGHEVRGILSHAHRLWPQDATSASNG